jgi:hypothetical protein
MQYATTPAWMYVVLLVLGAAFILGDVIVLIGAPQAVGPVAWIWLAMSSGFILVAVQGLASARNDDRVRRTGIRARGTVLSATATRASVNRIPQWALALRVESGGDPYDATLKVATGVPPPSGTALAVRVDPLRRDHVVLAPDDDPLPAPPATADTVRLLGELEQLHAGGSIGDADYETLKRKLLGEP